MDPEVTPAGAPQAPGIVAGSGGLKPLPTRVELKPVPPASTDGPDLSDPVEKHLAEFPETRGSSAPAQPAEAPPTLGAPPPEQPAEGVSQETPPADKPATVVAGQVPPVPGEKPAADKPVDEVPGAEPAPGAVAVIDPTKVGEKPAETPAAKPTYDPGEKFALADGVEWTRGQVVEGLRERQQLLADKPLAEEAKIFRDVFRTDAAKAQQVWKPLLEKLGREPNTLSLVSMIVDEADAAKVQYLSECSTYWDSPEGRAARAEMQPAYVPQQQVPAVDPVVRRELDELRTFRQQMQMRDDMARVNHEMKVIGDRYPFILKDQGLMDDLVLSAKALNQMDPSKGLLDAMQSKAAIYDSLLLAQSAGARATAPAPAPVVPATLGSAGAAPGGAKVPEDTRPRVFSDLDNAVESWIERHPD